MQLIKAFNGDADGLCALQQLSLHESHKGPNPWTSWQLITGVKRDIGLLAQIRQVKDAHITVLDISLDRNRAALEQLLAQRNRVVYIDHHFAGVIPCSPLLETHINTSSQTCTALLVNKLLQGRYASWALVGAFGDNLNARARAMAQTLDLEHEAQENLQQLGILLNYNSYGEDTGDLHAHPEDLYRAMQSCKDPLLFWSESPLVRTIKDGYQDDIHHLRSSKVHDSFPEGRVFVLPNAPWARRVTGIFANQCASEQPEKAHAILQERADGSLRISVRAPLDRPEGADLLCRQFSGGGGRAAAAGINSLPVHELDHFLTLFRWHFSRPYPPQVKEPDRK